jgi:hypothetical protein
LEQKHNRTHDVTVAFYEAGMDKDWTQPEESMTPARPSLAEEQRRAFEKDRKRVRKPVLGLRWPDHLIRN